MALYLDASALVKLTVLEPGSNDVRRLWHSAEPIASSVIAYPEVRSALAAKLRDRRLTARRYGWAAGHFDALWEEIEIVEINEPLALFAGALAERHGLRALDATHLASVLISSAAAFVSWDDDLRRAALAEGVDVFPA